MYELLRRVELEDPTRLAVVTYDDALTYGDLAAAARRSAARLGALPVPRLAVSDHEARVVVPLLAAASLVGVEVCQYPPPVAPSDGREETTDLLARMEHTVLVTDHAALADAAPIVLSTAEALGLAEPDSPAEPSVSPVELVEASDVLSIPQTLRAREVPPGSRTEARPHLVLTTGTTGAPRGVRHDWNRLVRSVRRVQPAPDERWLLAYGLHQFAGLQVLLHVFAAGATLVAPAPRRPVEGLAAMRELGVTHASATPTYWRFLLAQARSDGGVLPPLRQITLGGEAIPGPLLAELRTAFPTASVSQVYAASEFGSTGSVRDGRPGLSVDALERGDDADVDLKVVDGELWIRSRIGMLGYHGEPPVEPDAWRPTGDLVEIVGDRVEFRGRSSEVINVGGVKVHPLPIEERVGAVPGVDMARVYGRPNPMVGAVVALEVVAAPGQDLDALKTALREACADLPSAARPRSITFVDDVTTAGSKIVRRSE